MDLDRQHSTKFQHRAAHDAELAFFGLPYGVFAINGRIFVTYFDSVEELGTKPFRWTRDHRSGQGQGQGQGQASEIAEPPITSLSKSARKWL